MCPGFEKTSCQHHRATCTCILVGNLKHNNPYLEHLGPFNHGLERVRGLVYCNLELISCSGWVHLQTCTSVCMLQPGGGPPPRYPSGLWEGSAVA